MLLDPIVGCHIAVIVAGARGMMVRAASSGDDLRTTRSRVLGVAIAVVKTTTAGSTLWRRLHGGWVVS